MDLSQKALIWLAAAACCTVPISAEESSKEIATDEIDPRYIAYLMQIQEFSSSINLYQQYRKAYGKHNFEVLEQMALILLEQGARSADADNQLLSIFGAGIASIYSLDVLESGIKSPHPETQMAAIQFLGRVQDDRSDELLNRAMGSEFFFARMSAAEQLALRKYRSAVGQIEALMYRVPPPFRAYFPPFFAAIGTNEAIAVLRHLMDDRQHSVRIEAIMSAAMQGRDDLLPLIRSRATHLNLAEQEASSAALGILKDSKSIALLNRLAVSPSPNVQLAIYKSLFLLGDMSSKEKIMAMAKEKNLFAISTCGMIPGTEDLLAELLANEDMQVRFNAAIALLQRKDPRCHPFLYEILLRDSRDLGFQPLFSVGRSQMAWKVTASLKQHAKDAFYDMQALSLQVREHLLRECLELPENVFLTVASRIFDSRQTELIPLLVSLLENLQTEGAIALLEKRSQTAGAPLIRAYCNLSLYRMGRPGPHLQKLEDWISQNKANEMIRFRNSVPWTMKLPDASFELTPEESSRLLIESYQALALKHEEKSIDLLLEALKEGSPKNRYVLAGLLLLAIQ